MHTPLTAAALEKKYKALNMKQEKIDLVHKYFNCVSNLYGFLSLNDIYSLMKDYEGNIIRKKDFLALSEIIQREEQDYIIFDAGEIFKGDDPSDNGSKILCNKKLVTIGYYKFANIYDVGDFREKLSIFIFDRKEDFYKFEKDQFYESNIGRLFTNYLKGLKTDGHGREMEKEYTLTDPDGNSIKGKKITDVIAYSLLENASLSFEKGYNRKYLLNRINKTIYEKILDEIWYNTSVVTSNIGEEEEQCCKILDVYGVKITDFDSFITLLEDFNKDTHMFKLYGWSLNDMQRFLDMNMDGEEENENI